MLLLPLWLRGGAGKVSPRRSVSGVDPARGARSVGPTPYGVHVPSLVRRCISRALACLRGAVYCSGAVVVAAVVAVVSVASVVVAVAAVVVASLVAVVVVVVAAAAVVAAVVVVVVAVVVDVDAACAATVVPTGIAALSGRGPVYIVCCFPGAFGAAVVFVTGTSARMPTYSCASSACP